MGVVYSLTPELRLKLKEPIGTLIRGSFAETTKGFQKIVTAEKPAIIISVGDTVTRNLSSSGFTLHMAIVDNFAMRKSIQPVSLAAKKTIHVRNPQATITEEAIAAIQRALENKESVKIVVDGEEDLLVLITVRYAPVGSYVVYGQPHEGIVVVKVTPEKKAEVERILKDMAKSSKS